MKILQYRFVVVLLIILFFQTVNAQHILTQLGRHPFHQPSLTSSSDLIAMVNDNENDIRNGFEIVGLSEIFDDFVSQLPDAEIKIVKIHDGSHFEWMFARRNGEGPVRIAKDVTWISNTSFSAYQFYIDKDDKRYNFIVPLICGNLALSGITSTPAAFIVPVEETIDKPVEEPMAVTVMPIKETLEDVSEPVAVTVLPVEQTLDKTSEPVATYQPGKTVALPAVATGLKFLADIGYFHQFDPGHFFLGRVGIEYNLADNLSLLGLVGIAPHFSGTDGKTAYLVDILGEFKFDKSFINLGIGGWLTKGDDDIPMENTQIDVIAAIGTRIFGESDEFNISLFLETRQGIKEIDTIHEIRAFGRYGGGLRFKF